MSQIVRAFGNIMGDKLLSSTLTSSVASIAALNFMDSTKYHSYLVEGRITVDINASTLDFQVTQDGGTSYLSAAGSYGYGTYCWSPVSGFFSLTSNSATFIRLSDAVSNGANDVWKFSLLLMEPHKTTGYKEININGFGGNNGSQNIYGIGGHGKVINTGAYNGFKIFTGNNFTAGSSIKVWGFRA